MPEGTTDGRLDEADSSISRVALSPDGETAAVMLAGKRAVWISSTCVAPRSRVGTPNCCLRPAHGSIFVHQRVILDPIDRWPTRKNRHPGRQLAHAEGTARDHETA